MSADPFAGRDLCIVGAGPAGTSTALHLVAAAPELAARLVVIDKARFPREKICAGALGGRAERALERIGVRLDVPSLPIAAMRARLDASTVVEARRARIGRVVRRVELDAALVAAVRARGVAMVEGVSVSAMSPGRPEDPVALAIDGLVHRFSLVVGADGVGSVVRRGLGVPFGRLRAQAVEIDTEPVASDGPRDTLAFDFAGAGGCGYTWDFPTLLRGEPLVCRGAYVLVAHSRGRDDDADRVLSRHLERLGGPRERGPRKRFAERGLPLRQPVSAPRVLLVGEAAGIDPFFGEGIAQAIGYGAFAGPYLASALRRGDLSFRDARRRLFASRLGVDLALRSALAPVYYGGVHAPFHAAARSASVLDACLRYFAGEPVLTQRRRHDVALGGAAPSP